MVRFLEDPEQYKTCEIIEHIDSSIQRYAIPNKYINGLSPKENNMFIFPFDFTT